jgi:ABC-2 type transport system permease protein
VTPAWRPVGLVARREITTRLKSKAFRISTLVLLGLLVGFSVVLRFVGSSSAHPVGFYQPERLAGRAVRGGGRGVGHAGADLDGARSGHW